MFRIGSGGTLHPSIAPRSPAPPIQPLVVSLYILPLYMYIYILAPCNIYPPRLAFLYFALYGMCYSPILFGEIIWGDFGVSRRGLFSSQTQRLLNDYWWQWEAKTYSFLSSFNDLFWSFSWIIWSTIFFTSCEFCELSIVILSFRL